MRKLATIRKIDILRPIKDADAIECAIIGGWSVVAQKGLYKEGDLAVYCEVDSWIPTSIASFLSKGNEPSEYNGVKGERLRTIRLRKQLSQGLLLPFSNFDNSIYWKEGDDVTEVLGILKYEAPVPVELSGVAKGMLPIEFPKTDEERIQNLTAEWDQLSTLTYEVTEKLEGSSMSVGMLNNEFIVCGRNVNFVESKSNSLWSEARKYDIETKLKEENMDNLIFQGEIIGHGVRGNYYDIKDRDFYVYAVYDVQAGLYISPVSRKELCDRLGLKHVPILSTDCNLGSLSVDDVLTMSDGKSHINPNKLREGVVYKQVDGQTHWKAVSNQYLLKTGG